MSESVEKLRLSALIALVVGSMIGGGFSPCHKTWPSARESAPC